MFCFKENDLEKIRLVEYDLLHLMNATFMNKTNFLDRKIEVEWNQNK